MRTSKKQALITTAVSIVEKAGLEALTYDSLAQASGLSKSGLIYHFPTREAMLLEINSKLAADWEAELVRVAGAPASELGLRERVRALLHTLSSNATRADLLLTLDARHKPKLQAVWDNVLNRWNVPQEMLRDNPQLFLINVIGDGLWIHDHINGFSLSDEERALLIQAAENLLA